MSETPAVFLCQVCDQTPERGHAPDCPGWLTMTDEARTLAERCELLARQLEVERVAVEWHNAKLEAAKREAVEAFYAAVMARARRDEAAGVRIYVAVANALDAEMARIREGKDATPDPDQRNRAAFGVGLFPGDRHE